MARSDYYANGLFAGGACACCGTWVRVKPIFVGTPTEPVYGLLYGSGCAKKVTHLRFLIRSMDRATVRDLAEELLEKRINAPKRYTHVRTLLGLSDSEVLAKIFANQEARKRV